MNAVQKVKEICKSRKIPIYRLEKDLGFANGYISQLRKGTFPNDRLAQIANYLSVPAEYLMEGNTEEQKENPTAQTSSEVSEARQALMQTVLDCPEEDLDRLQAIIQLFLSGNR